MGCGARVSMPSKLLYQPKKPLLDEEAFLFLRTRENKVFLKFAHF